MFQEPFRLQERVRRKLKVVLCACQTEQIGRLFNFDGALTKRKQIPNEMGLAVW